MMSRLVILMLFFYLFSSQPSPTEAAGACDIRSMTRCWTHFYSVYCMRGACPEDVECRVIVQLKNCMQVFCRHDDMLDFPFAKLFGSCSE